MDKRILTDEEWFQIANFLPGKPTDKGGRAADNQLFVEAVLYLARTGSPWQDLLKEFDSLHSVYVRLARWKGYGGLASHCLSTAKRCRLSRAIY